MNQLLVHVFGFMHHARHTEALFDALTSVACHGLGTLRVVDQLEDRLSKTLRISRRNQQSCLAVAHQLGIAANRGGDHRTSCRHRFQECVGASFIP